MYYTSNVTLSIGEAITNKTGSRNSLDVDVAATIAVAALFLIFCLPGAGLNVLLVVAMRHHGGSLLRKLEHGLSYNAAVINVAACLLWMPCHVLRCVAALMFSSTASLALAVIYLSDCLFFFFVAAWLVTLCGLCVHRAYRASLGSSTSGSRSANRLAFGLSITSWTSALAIAILAAVDLCWVLMSTGGHESVGYYHTHDDNNINAVSTTVSPLSLLSFVSTSVIFTVILLICIMSFLSSLRAQQSANSSVRNNPYSSDYLRKTSAAGTNGDILTTVGVPSYQGQRFSRDNACDIDDDDDDDVTISLDPKSVSCKMVSTNDKVAPLSNMNNASSVNASVTSSVAPKATVVKCSSSSNSNVRTVIATSPTKKSTAKGRKQSKQDDDDIDDDTFDMQMRAKMQSSRSGSDRRHTVANIGADAGSLLGSRGGVDRGGKNGRGGLGGLFSGSGSGGVRENKPASRQTNYNYVRKFSVDLVALQNQLENPKKLGSMDTFQRPSHSQCDLKIAAAKDEAASAAAAAATAAAAAAAVEEEMKRKEEEQQNAQKQRLIQLQQQHLQQQQQRANARQQKHRLSETAEEAEDPPTASGADNLTTLTISDDANDVLVAAITVSQLPAVTSTANCVTLQSSTKDVSTTTNSESPLPFTEKCSTDLPPIEIPANTEESVATVEQHQEHQHPSSPRKPSTASRCTAEIERMGRGKRHGRSAKRVKKEVRRWHGVSLMALILLACLLPWLLAEFCLATASIVASMRALWAALSPALFVVLLTRADSRYAKSFKKLVNALRRCRCVCYCNVGSASHVCCCDSPTSSVAKS
jgi:hypothetical protein